MAKASKTKKKTSKLEKEPSLTAALHAVTRSARTHLARHLVRSGLYAGQESIVEIIDANGTIASGEIARKLGVRAPTITKSLTRLEEQGFIARTQHKADKRIVVVSLTKQGRTALKKARKATRKAEKQILAGLSQKQIKQVSRAITHMSSNMEESQAKPAKKAAK